VGSEFINLNSRQLIRRNRTQKMNKRSRVFRREKVVHTIVPVFFSREKFSGFRNGHRAITPLEEAYLARKIVAFRHGLVIEPTPHFE